MKRNRERDRRAGIERDKCSGVLVKEREKETDKLDIKRIRERDRERDRERE